MKVAKDGREVCPYYLVVSVIISPSGSLYEGNKKVAGVCRFTLIDIVAVVMKLGAELTKTT